VFANRSAVELMTLAFTALIAIVVIVGTVVVSIAELMDPTVDTSAAVHGLTSIITGILGALLGLMAGKADVVNERPDHDTH
jgi:uncharacterized protein (DUF983 family)